MNPDDLKHNLKLTPREQKIILVKFIIHGNSPFADAPLDTRVRMLQAAAQIYGFEYDDEEWQEIGRACLATQDRLIKELAKSLKKDPDLYQAAMRNIQNGNDRIISVIDPFLQKGLKKLGFGKSDKEKMR